jgi:formate hydrogenlyase subunit 6/NADH:ubiquinone oxidoreductase subunit I
METKLLRKASLATLVRTLHESGRKVLAPVRKEGVVDFAAIADVAEMAVDYIVTVQSAKAVAFPKVEGLFEIQTGRDAVVLKERDLAQLPELILVGARPCDAAGFTALNAIFTGDGVDAIFAERLRKTALISISCSACDAKCFCTSVNGNPGATEGSDILLTRLDTGDYLAELVSEKGRELAAKHSGLFEPAPAVDKNKFVVSVPVAFDLPLILNNISRGFDLPVWLEQSLRCLGCGACAYVCPNCACFDIQDVHNGKEGSRKRSWDSCGFSLFTLHASGHNPRKDQGSRWRQRVMHKFAYMPERGQGIGCVGCGRCGRACAVDMDLKEHLQQLAKALAK